MTRTMRILALTAALGGAVVANRAIAADQPAAAEAKRAKIGDEVSCAKDGMKMELEADTPSADVGGKTYYFCSESEKKAFLSDPEHKSGH